VNALIRIDDDVRRAVGRRQAVVALESSVLAQGLPIPHNRSAAERMSAAVSQADALPAITAVVAGKPAVGITAEELERFLRRDGVAKVSARDLPWAMTKGLDGATTVAASLMLAAGAGVDVFATGGIGGVHPEPAYDESADLAELARTPIVVVCSGAKSILDLPATWERLESLGIPVVGFQTDELPGFYTAHTGIALSARADHVGEIVELFHAQRALGRPQALLVVQPPPPEHALDRKAVEDAVARARADAAQRGVRGAEATPYLLSAIGESTGGASLQTNLALLERNAGLAGEIARAASAH